MHTCMHQLTNTDAFFSGSPASTRRPTDATEAPKGAGARARAGCSRAWHSLLLASIPSSPIRLQSPPSPDRYAPLRSPPRPRSLSPRQPRSRRRSIRPPRASRERSGEYYLVRSVCRGLAAFAGVASALRAGCWWRGEGGILGFGLVAAVIYGRRLIRLASIRSRFCRFC